jgi:hypothetical protein
MRPCGNCPTRLNSIMSRTGGYSTASPETFSSARWAAAPDAVRLAPANQAAAPREARPQAATGYHSNCLLRCQSLTGVVRPRRKEDAGQMMGVQAEKNLVFAAHDQSDLTLDIYLPRTTTR